MLKYIVCIILLGAFLNNLNAKEMGNKCDSVEFGIIRLYVNELFYRNDSTSNLNEDCLNSFINKLASSKGKKRIQFTFYNNSKKYRLLNKYFFNIVEEFFITSGIKEDDMYERYSTPHELPIPIGFNEEDFGQQDDGKNNAYFEFYIWKK